MTESTIDRIDTLHSGIRRHRRSMILAILTVDRRRLQQSRLMLEGLKAAKKKAVQKGVV